MKVKLKTGLGYIKNKEGKIISKFDLPVGEHNFPDDVEVVEVENREELAKIEVVPEEPSIEEPTPSVDVIQEIENIKKDIQTIKEALNISDKNV